MTLVKFNERNGRDPMTPGFNDIFESIFTDSLISGRMTSRVPAVNICESDGHYHIELGAPGLKKEDFKIDLDRNMLNISVEKKLREQKSTKSTTQGNTVILPLYAPSPYPTPPMKGISKLNTQMGR